MTNRTNKSWCSSEAKTRAKLRKCWNLSCLPPLLPTQPTPGVTNWDASQPGFLWPAQIFSNVPITCQHLKSGNVTRPSSLAGSLEVAEPSQPSHVTSGHSREATAPLCTERLPPLCCLPNYFLSGPSHSFLLSALPLQACELITFENEILPSAL